MKLIVAAYPLVASDVEPVREFWEPGIGIELTDHRVDSFLTEPVLKFGDADHKLYNRNRRPPGYQHVYTFMDACVWSESAHSQLTWPKN